MTPAPDMSDLATPERMVEELAQFRCPKGGGPPPVDAEIMEQWDRIRAMLLRGNRGSLPRDTFEALISFFYEHLSDAATLIEAQGARIRRLEAEIAGVKSLMWPESGGSR